jgi:hypothetical protein
MELNERKRKIFSKQHNLFKTYLTDIAGIKMVHFNLKRILKTIACNVFVTRPIM